MRNYLLNKDFLKALHEQPILSQTIRVNVLDWNDQAIGAIEGLVTSGSLNVNGDSAIRRTGSLTLVADPSIYKIQDVNNLISINKRVSLEIGLSNNTGLEMDCNIAWIPLGVYIITSASITKNNSGINISLNIKDKMVLLNGECGGTFPIGIIHSPDKDKKEVAIIDLIYALLDEYAHIPKHRIYIDGIERKIKNSARWASHSTIYSVKISEKIYYLISAAENPDIVNQGAIAYSYGDTLGYVNTLFSYPGELSSNAGETVVSVLDKIKNTLGNFEYFFDINGIFHFQPIKNFLNEGSAELDLNKAFEDSYLVSDNYGKSVYTFEDSRLMTAIANNPKFEGIKNDISIWGVSNNKQGIHYHLIIDDKPLFDSSKWYYGEFYNDEFGIKRARKKNLIDTQNTPAVYESNGLYFTWKEGAEGTLIIQGTAKESPDGVAVGYLSHEKKFLAKAGHHYVLNSTEIQNNSQNNISFGLNPGNSLIKDTYSPDKDTYLTIQVRVKITTGSTYNYEIRPTIYESFIQAADWRSAIYLDYVLEDIESPYAKEIENSWPKIYDLENKKFYATGNDTLRLLNSMPYFIDMIDGNGTLADFKISKIGRREKVINNDKVNTLFNPAFPDIVYIAAGNDDITAAERAEAIDKEQAFCQINAKLAESLALGSTINSAYDNVRSMLHEMTSYNETINITSIPLYFLEPNTRVTVNDEDTGVKGDYIIKTLSVPLTHNGTMTISANKAIERI